MEEIDLNKLAELFFNCYDRKYKKCELPESYSESYLKFVETLNKKQRKLYFDFDLCCMDYHIESQKHAIKFMLDLLCPDP